MRFAVPVRIAQSNLLPLSWEEVTTHLRVDVQEDSAEGRYLKSLMAMVRDTAESSTHLQLMPASYELTLNGWWTGETLLRAVPYLELESVHYFNGSGDQVQLPEASYRVRKIGQMLGAVTLTASALPGLHLENNRVRTDAIAIRFKAGFATAAEVPGNIKLGMLAMLAEAWDNRRDTPDDRNRLSESLFELERWVSIA